MTRNAAARAAQILHEIDSLQSMRNDLEKANSVSGHINIENNGLGFCWVKGEADGKYVKYILDGIDSEIAQLEDEIKCL